MVNLSQNQLMNIGLGLMAGGTSRGQINPLQAAMSGLMTGQQMDLAQEDRERRKKQDEREAAQWEAQQAQQRALYQALGVPMPGAAPPAPAGAPGTQYAQAGGNAPTSLLPGSQPPSGALGAPVPSAGGLPAQAPQAATGGAPVQPQNPLLAAMGLTPQTASLMAPAIAQNPAMIPQLMQQQAARNQPQMVKGADGYNYWVRPGQPPQRVVPGAQRVDPKLLSPEAQAQAIERAQAGRSSTTIQNMGSIPQGYELYTTPGGGRAMRPIPGGPADLEQQAAAEAETVAARSQQQGTDLMLDEIQRSLALAEDEEGLPTTGTVGGFLSNIAETDAGALRSRLQTIKANIGFDRLQQMREASPTGGALGNVTEGELARLESVMGNLEQAQRREDFIYNLRRLQDTYLDTVHGVGNRPNEAEGETPTGNRFEGMSRNDLLLIDPNSITSDEDLAAYERALGF